MKPMTTEEIDDAANCAAGYKKRAGKMLKDAVSETDRADADALYEAADTIDSLIATARLAPQWRKGSEPPDTNRVVIGAYADEVRSVCHLGSFGWCDLDGEYEMPPPYLWCELPTPPSEQEGGR